MIPLENFAKVFEDDLKDTTKLAMFDVGREAHKRAVDMFGHYDNGAGWTPLTKTALRKHDRPKYAPPLLAKYGTTDTPLVLTGELRDSVEWDLTPTGVEIGTNNPKMMVHELGGFIGDSFVPARPVFGPVADSMEEKVHEIFAHRIMTNMGEK